MEEFTGHLPDKDTWYSPHIGSCTWTVYVWCYTYQLYNPLDTTFASGWQKWLSVLVILYNTTDCPPCVCVSVGHKFYIHLALPISPEIIEGFWCSKCLNDRIKVPDMMRLFAGWATTPLEVKIWTKQPWVKINNSRNFDHNFALFRGKIWLQLFYNFFCVMVPRFYTKKSQVISSKNEGVTAIFPNIDLIWNLKNQCHTLIFGQNDLRLFL